MKAALLMVLCCASMLVSGCAAGITRIGYQLPKGKTPKDLPRCPIAIKNSAKYDTNDVVILGTIHDYDTGFSTGCDEAYVLDIFCREACMLGADIINITEEKQPSAWTSTCYRAKAQFFRFKDREKTMGLVSDAKYTPELIIDRSVKYNQRNREIIAGAVVGGLVGAIIVTAVTDPNGQTNTNYSNAVSPKNAK